MFRSVTKALIVSWSMKVVALDYVSHLIVEEQNEDPDAGIRHDPYLIWFSILG